MISATPTSVTGFTVFSSLAWSGALYGCRTNRVLPGPKSLADMLLRVLQELVGPAQGIPAAIQYLRGCLLYCPDALRDGRAHPAGLLSHVLLHLPAPYPHRRR